MVKDFVALQLCKFPKRSFNIINRPDFSVGALLLFSVAICGRVLNVMIENTKLFLDITFYGISDNLDLR